MTNSSTLYLLGMLLLFIGERQVGGDDPTRWFLDATGLAAIVGALALLFVGRRTADGNQRKVYTSSLTWAGLGLASLAVYGLSTDTALDALALDDQAEQRFMVVITSLWILLWLIGTLPFLFLSRTLAEAPVRVSVRAPDAATAGLATALGLSLLLPLNYLASDTNERWDLGYFRTADPGTRTLSMVQNLEDPVRAVLFFPVSSDVTEEIRTYFDQLKGYNLEVEYVDHALEPELAKELKVRD
ncbi:MAG: hypothetical protein QGG40_19565, partial [Myxococcota bacterium]|nr:hypothetical protein [Myxococcota bacterium]